MINFFLSLKSYFCLAVYLKPLTSMKTAKERKELQIKKLIKKSYLRPWDFAIIILLILSSFLPLVVFAIQNENPVSTVTKQAILKVDGETIKVFDLEEGGKNYTYRYEDPDGDYNLIEVDGDRIRITKTNCGDLLCVRRGWISKAGESPIVCLPHKLSISIQASDGSEDGSLIY